MSHNPTSATLEKPRPRTTHQDVAQAITDRIRRGQLAASDKLPTFEDIKREFGVAANTVDRAMALLEEEGLIVRRRGSGTYVAEKPAKTRPLRVGLIGATDVPESDYWMRFLAGVHSAVVRNRAEVLIPRDLDHLNWAEYDGLLVHGDWMPEVMLARPASLPVVAADGFMPGIFSVTRNDFEAGFLAAQHLMDLGHRSIGYMGWLDSAAGILRQAGYRTALAQAGLPFEADLQWAFQHVENTCLEEFGALNLELWIQSGLLSLGCTALIVQNDFLAMGVIRALKAHGISVPGQVSVVGFDNERTAAEFIPAITSVGTDMFRIGSYATESLLKLISGGTLEAVETRLAVQLTARVSTAPAPTR